MKLVVLHGAPGVGKLTVGRELAPLTGYRLFHNHLTVDMVQAVFGFHSHAFRELREQVWLDMLGRAAEEDLPGVIFTLVFEPTLLPGFFDRLVDRVEAAGGRVIPIELRCSLEENERRIVQPDRRRYLKATDPAWLGGTLGNRDYDPPAGLVSSLVIDTTLLSARQTAARILDHLIASD